MNNKLLVVTGPTGVGKTAVSIQLAKALETDIISADSRQFYRELNIGTAKPAIDEMDGVRHHFTDFLSIHEHYTAGQFEIDALALLERLFQSHPVVIMAGGSGLYIDAVCHGLDEIPSSETARKTLRLQLETEGLSALREQLREADPVYYREVDLDNPHRVMRALEAFMESGLPYSSFRRNRKKKRAFDTIKIGLELDRKELYQRIDQRVDRMVGLGLLDEARMLHSFRELSALQTVGYSELFDHFEAKHTLEEAIDLIKRNSRRYAKRQLTWLKKDVGIQWFHPDDTAAMLSLAR